MANITYIDKYIIDGHKATMSLKKFYDTILVTNMPLRNNDDEIKDLYRIPLYDIFLRYREQFEVAVIEYFCPTSLYYQPKSVSEIIYGTTEMWISLLRLNKMRNITEFKRPNIKVYDPVMINELLEIFLKREGKV